ncbi:protein NLRC3-like, partial [Xiphophorus hellerii]|uniref:protein NLRC3-like n=1 Tax=Xiphophorus hellerii TaxID=8084 RepID=UPI0013B383DE
FKVPPGRGQPIRTVMTMGVAGIGKTLLTQKFTLDWAEGKTNQNIDFIFPFTFRELNMLKEERFSLLGLIHKLFSKTKEISSFKTFQVLFIFDGLDESRFTLDFNNNPILTDVTESSSVDVLVTNLIRRKLLPSALLWITTRPAAANQIPATFVDMATEVRGFTDPQKEEYFRKRFRDDEEKASRIISHIQKSKSLHIMCHIPVFCWITAKVLEDVMKTREGEKLPKTLTEMYIAEALERQTQQIGASACGATAVVDVLKALGVDVAPEEADRCVQTRLRRNESPLPDYLLSRSEAVAEGLGHAGRSRCASPSRDS